LKVKKHKLEVAMEEDFCLLGMVSDEPDYRLCWLLNQQLEMNFEKMDDLILHHRKLDQEQHFSHFVYNDEESMVTYRIVRNRTENGYFLEELKNLDYLIHIQGEVTPDKIDTFLQTTGNLEAVRICMPVNLQKIRNKERLMLW
jgi:hypothetical protein